MDITVCAGRKTIKRTQSSPAVFDVSPRSAALPKVSLGAHGPNHSRHLFIIKQTPDGRIH